MWVEAEKEEYPDIHPALINIDPDVRSTVKRWEEFTASGELTRTILLPADFSPLVIEGDYVAGLLRIPTGEIVIGALQDIGGG